MTINMNRSEIERFLTCPAGYFILGLSTESANSGETLLNNCHRRLIYRKNFTLSAYGAEIFQRGCAAVPDCLRRFTPRYCSTSRHIFPCRKGGTPWSISNVILGIHGCYKQRAICVTFAKWRFWNGNNFKARVCRPAQVLLLCGWYAGGCAGLCE